MNLIISLNARRLNTEIHELNSFFIYFIYNSFFILFIYLVCIQEGKKKNQKQKQKNKKTKNVKKVSDIDDNCLAWFRDFSLQAISNLNSC